MYVFRSIFFYCIWIRIILNPKLIVFSDSGPAREFAKRVLYELPADDSLGIERYSVLDCHSLNRVVFEFCFFALTTKSLPLLCVWKIAAVLQCCHVIRRANTSYSDKPCFLNNLLTSMVDPKMTMSQHGS